MIHVDVKQATDNWHRGFRVEVSVDGAPWAEHWFLPARGDNEFQARQMARAETYMYAAGIKFGGGRDGGVRMTAFGEDVYVLDK